MPRDVLANGDMAIQSLHKHAELIGPLQQRRACCQEIGSGEAAMTDIATPFSNVQPHLTLTEAMPLYGIYPSAGSGSAYWDTLGFVYDFAGNFAPISSIFPRFLPEPRRLMAAGNPSTTSNHRSGSSH
jgi:hypothetical protein